MCKTEKSSRIPLFLIFIEYFTLACFLLLKAQSIARRLRNSSAGTAVFLQKAQRPCGPCGPAPTRARFRRDSSESGRRERLGIFSDPALHWPMNPSLCGRRKGDDGGSTLPFPEAQAGTGIGRMRRRPPAQRTKAGRGGNSAPGRPSGLPEIAPWGVKQVLMLWQAWEQAWEGGLLHSPSFPHRSPASA